MSFMNGTDHQEQKYLWFDQLNYEMPVEALDFMSIFDVNDQPKPYKHVTYVEVKWWDSDDVRELKEALNRYLLERGLNHAISMTFAGVLIFTEEEWKTDPLMFKLTTGTDIGKTQPYNLSEKLKSVYPLKHKYGKLIRECDSI